MSIGGKLRYLRIIMKKTLREQSEAFGTSINSLYRWEHDIVEPRRAVLEKMADYYCVPVEWLISGSADIGVEKQHLAN